MELNETAALFIATSIDHLSVTSCFIAELFMFDEVGNHRDS